MPVDEPTRERVHARLRDALGEEVAATLMAGLPPIAWTELARNDTVLALRTDVDGLRTDVDGLRTDVDGLRTDVDGLREDQGILRGEVVALRHELRGELGRLEARILREQALQVRTFMVAMVGAVISTGAMAFAAAGLT